MSSGTLADLKLCSTVQLRKVGDFSKPSRSCVWTLCERPWRWRGHSSAAGPLPLGWTTTGPRPTRARSIRQQRRWGLIASRLREDEQQKLWMACRGAVSSRRAQRAWFVDGSDSRFIKGSLAVKLRLYDIRVAWEKIVESTHNHTTTHPIPFHPVPLHHITSLHITRQYLTWRHITSHRATWHHITSHHITSHDITSNHTTWQHMTWHDTSQPTDKHNQPPPNTTARQNGWRAVQIKNLVWHRTHQGPCAHSIGTHFVWLICSFPWNFRPRLARVLFGSLIAPWWLVAEKQKRKNSKLGASYLQTWTRSFLNKGAETIFFKGRLFWVPGHTSRIRWGQVMCLKQTRSILVWLTFSEVGFDPSSGNPYSGKVVVMDEGHNLTRPNRLYEVQLRNLRGYMETAVNTVFVSCTGSMEADLSSDPRTLLDAVKGIPSRGLSDEGFLSSHHKRGPSFPLQQPAACADGVYSTQVQAQVTTYAELAGTSLVRYVYQAVKLHKEGKGDETLANYTNMYVYFGSAGQQACKQTLTHNPDSRPKFGPVVAAVVEAARKRQKSLVMIRRQTGYKALLSLMQDAADQHGFGIAEYGQLGLEIGPIRLAILVDVGYIVVRLVLADPLRETIRPSRGGPVECVLKQHWRWTVGIAMQPPVHARNMAEFNHRTNLWGQNFMVMILEAEKGSEGIEFHAVRHAIYVDVPDTLSVYKQRCGRVVRCGSHNGLPDSQRSVRFMFLAARFPEFARNELLVAH